MSAPVEDWDGSVQRAVAVPGDGRTLELWDTARVVAGEPAQLGVVGVGDVGRHAYRWRLLAKRWAGAPFWGSGPPPMAAIGSARFPGSDEAPGRGPDGAPSWSPANRFIAVPGSRGDRAADTAMLEWVAATYGPVHVALGHGEGARLVQTSAGPETTTVLLDGGLPLGPDQDDTDLERSWTLTPPDAVLVAAHQPTRYNVNDVADFLARHPTTPWRRIGDIDHPGIDHDRLVDSDYAAMILPGLVHRARNRRRL